MNDRVEILAVFLAFSIISLCAASCQFVVQENSPANSFVGNILRAECRDNPHIDVSKITSINFYSQNIKQSEKYAITFMTIDKEGNLYLAKPIDRDDRLLECPKSDVNCTKSITVVYYHSDNIYLLKFDLIIQDVNDLSPMFLGPFSTSVSESDGLSTRISLPEAVDDDAGQNGDVSYQIIDSDGGDDMFRLEIDNKMPFLKVLKALDFETQSVYKLVLQACDKGLQTRCGNATFTLNIIDANDHSPEFTEKEYKFSIKESLYVKGSRKSFGFVSASDKDSKEFGRVTYRLENTQTSTNSKTIEIDADSGELFVVGPLNVRQTSQMTLTVIASDQGLPPRESKASLVLTIVDVNDHAPAISLSLSPGVPKPSLFIEENMVIKNDQKKKVTSIFVTDEDTGKNAQFSCRTGELSGKDFFLELNSGNTGVENIRVYNIYSLQAYDREKVDKVYLDIICWDIPESSERPLTSTTTLTFTIQDENEFRPIFDQSTYQGKVYENANNAMVITVRATDQDATSKLVYSIQDDGGSFAYKNFLIDPDTGVIRTAMPLDRESLVEKTGQPFYTFTATASDGVYTVSTQVRVEILDVNDEIPYLSKESKLFIINETYGTNSNVRQTLPTLKYFDKDDPNTNNSKAVFELGHVLRHPHLVNFYLSPNGVLQVEGVLDREKFDKVEFMVILKDLGIPQQSSTGTVTIELQDINDNPPELQNLRNGDYPMTVNITDEHIEGSVVYEVEAFDIDLCNSQGVRYMTSRDCMVKANFTFNLANQRVNLFSIDSEGLIKVKNHLTPGSYVLNVTVTDHGYPKPLTSSGILRVNVARNPQALYFGKHSWNWTILLIIIVVSTFVTVILVVAIVMLNRNQPCLQRGGSRRHDYDGNVKDHNGFEIDPMYAESRRLECMGGPLTTFGQPPTPLHGDLYRRENGLAPNGFHHPGNVYVGDLEVASADSGHGASEEEAMFEHRNGTMDQRLMPQQTFPMRCRSPLCNCSSQREDDLLYPRRCPEHAPLTGTFGKPRAFEDKPLTLLRDPQFNNISLSNSQEYRSLCRQNMVQGSLLSPIAGSRSATPVNFYTNHNSTPAQTATVSSAAAPPTSQPLHVNLTSKSANV